MSSVGFKPPPDEDAELKQLREAVEDLNSVLNNIKDGQTQIDHLNLGLAKEHLKVALDYGRKAKKTITEIGKQKAKR